MTLRKLALAGMIGGLAAVGPAVPATAESVPNQLFTTVRIGANPGTTFARGVINGVGVENNNRLQVPPGAPFQVVVSFPEGDLFETATPAGAQVEFDPFTCVTRSTIESNLVITGGTGSLAGASGDVHATAQLTAIGPRDGNGACLGPDAPATFLFSVVHLTGTVGLG